MMDRNELANWIDGILSEHEKHAFTTVPLCPATLREIRDALRQSAWRPMSEAPRDGTRILLGRPDVDGDGGTSVCGYWLDALEDGVDYMGHDGGFTDVDYQVFQPGRSFGAEAYSFVGNQPTAWQPLPPPPADEVVG